MLSILNGFKNYRPIKTDFSPPPQLPVAILDFCRIIVLVTEVPLILENEHFHL